MEERARPGPYLLFTLAGWSGPVVVFAEAGNEGRGKKNGRLWYVGRLLHSADGSMDV